MTEPADDQPADSGEPPSGIALGVLLGLIGWLILICLCVLVWVITR